MNACPLPLRLLPLGVAIALLAACGDGDPGSPFVITDGVGTGSHGGNPFVLAFDAEGETEGVTWTAVAFFVGDGRMATAAPDGGCPIDDAPWVAIDTTVTLGALRAFAADNAPCALDLRPPADGATPLLLAEATLAVDGVTVPMALRWPLADGVRMTVTDPSRVESLGGAVLVIDRAALLDGLDLSAPPDGVDLLLFDAGASPAEREVLLRNLVAATRVYVDPDPSDGTLTAAERVPANIAAEFRGIP